MQKRRASFAWFSYAHRADPDALLIYNDDNNELDGKREKMIRLIESLRAQPVPLHAIGLQGHYELDSVPLEALKRLWRRCGEWG